MDNQIAGSTSVIPGKLHLFILDHNTARSDSITALAGKYDFLETPRHANPFFDWKQTISDWTPDLVVLSVDEDLIGFDLARHIHEHYPNAWFAFIGNSSLAYAAFSYPTLDFLPEHFTADRFDRLISRLQRVCIYPASSRKLTLYEVNALAYRHGNSFSKIQLNNILYIERSGREVIFHMPTEDIATRKYSLSQLEELLSPIGFYRVHQSFLVSFDRIESVTNDITKNSFELRLEGVDNPIPTSRDKALQILKFLDDIYPFTIS